MHPPDLSKHTWQSKTSKSRCCINIPNTAFWAAATEKKQAHTEKEKKMWDLSPRLPDQKITDALSDRFPQSKSQQIAKFSLYKYVQSILFLLNELRNCFTIVMAA